MVKKLQSHKGRKNSCRMILTGYWSYRNLIYPIKEMGFFQAVAGSSLIYESTIYNKTNKEKARLKNGACCFENFMEAISNKTEIVPLLTPNPHTIIVRPARHYWRRGDKLISAIFLWTYQCLLRKTYIRFVRTQYAAQKNVQEQLVIDRERERERE